MTTINKLLYNVDQRPDTSAEERKLARKNIGIDEVIGGKSTESEKHIPPLGTDGIIPGEYLPSYVDDVVEGYYHDGKFYKDSGYTQEITGETSKIYVDLSDGSKGKTYRYSGSQYVLISGQDAFGVIKYGNDTVSADGLTDTLELAATGPVTIALDSSNDKVTFGVTVTDEYLSTGTNPVSGKAVNNAFTTITGSVDGTPGSNMTMTAFSQANGVVSAKFETISIQRNQVSDFSHPHGNISDDGTIADSNKRDIGNGYSLVTYNNGFYRSTLTFGDNTETNASKALCSNGKFVEHAAGNGINHTYDSTNSKFTWTLKSAASNEVGGVKVGYNPGSDATKRPLKLNTDGQAYVEIPGNGGLNAGTDLIITNNGIVQVDTDGTISNSTHAFVCGTGCSITSSSDSFVGGNANSISDGQTSFIFGTSNSITGSVRSVILGDNNNITFSQQFPRSGAGYKILIGYNLTASNELAQDTLIMGRYNDSLATSVANNVIRLTGAGTSDSDRKNVEWLTRDGLLCTARGFETFDSVVGTDTYSGSLAADTTDSNKVKLKLSTLFSTTGASNVISGCNGELSIENIQHGNTRHYTNINHSKINTEKLYMHEGTGIDSYFSLATSTYATGTDAAIMNKLSTAFTSVNNAGTRNRVRLIGTDGSTGATGYKRLGNLSVGTIALNVISASDTSQDKPLLPSCVAGEINVLRLSESTPLYVFDERSSAGSSSSYISQFTGDDVALAVTLKARSLEDATARASDQDPECGRIELMVSRSLLGSEIQKLNKRITDISLINKISMDADAMVGTTVDSGYSTTYSASVTFDVVGWPFIKSGLMIFTVNSTDLETSSMRVSVLYRVGSGGSWTMIFQETVQGGTYTGMFLYEVNRTYDVVVSTKHSGNTINLRYCKIDKMLV